MRTLKAFCLRQREITVRPLPFPISHAAVSIVISHNAQDVLTTLIRAHAGKPLPTPLVLEGNGYTLTLCPSLRTGVHICVLIRAEATKAWAYERSLDFSWGDAQLEPDGEKWLVTFARV
jgi:hypothetical protein